MKIKGFLFKKARRTFSVAFFVVTTFLFSSFVISNNVLAKTMKIGSSTTDISQVIGRMGIGTDSPGATLQINPATSTEGLRIISSNYSPFVIRNSANTADLFRIDQSGNIVGGNAGSWTLNGSNLYPVSTSYNVGIGTTNPGSNKLYVLGNTYLNGTTYSSGALYSANDIYTNGAGDDLWLGNSSQASANFRAYATGELHIDADSIPISLGEGQDADIYYNGTNLFINPQVVGSGSTIFPAGNVGIGTTNPTQKLTVAGNVGFDTGKFTTDGSGNATFESFLDKSNVLYKLDPSNTGTSLNVAGSGVFGGDLTVNGGDITVNNNNGGVSFSDNSAYWLRTSTNWGLYWDTSANQFKFNGGGATRASIDLDDGKAYFNGSVSADSFAAISASGEGLHILSPGGAKYQTKTSTITGAIKIVLPQSWTSTMMRMKVDIYEYANSESFSVYLGGYNYGDESKWINTFAQIIGGKVNRDFTVRFGHDGTKAAIWIGETTSTWSYPQVVVSDFYAGFNNFSIDQWDDGWDIIFDTTFTDDTITSTQSNNLISPWVSNGTSIYNISSGNVGIGVTAPADKLHLGSGSLRISSLLNCSGTGQAVKTDSSGRLLCGSVSGGITGSGTTNYVARWTGASTLGKGVLYDNGTNVGIGVTSPAAKLDVNGAVKTSRLGTYGTYSSTQVQGIWSISEGYPISTTNNNFGTQYGIGYAYNTTGGAPFSATHQIVFTNNGTINAAIGLDGRGYFKKNVGIGTTAPAKQLEIYHSTRPVMLLNTGTYSINPESLAVQGGVEFENNAIDKKAGIYGAVPPSYHTPGLLFQVKSAYNGVTSQMYFHPNGNLGINTTNPTTKLYVNGDTTNTGYLSITGAQNTSGNIRFSAGNPYIKASSYIIIPGGIYVSGGTPYFANRIEARGGIHNDTASYLTVHGGTSGNTYFNGKVGIGTTSPSVKLEVNGEVKGVSFTYTSDISYKKDVETIENPIAKIQALRGVRFNWKKDNTPAIGLIAQEVEKVFPEVVIGEEGNKGVSYGALVAPLIEAVKAQQEQIDLLREKIELLEKKN